MRAKCMFHRSPKRSPTAIDRHSGRTGPRVTDTKGTRVRRVFRVPSSPSRPHAGRGQRRCVRAPPSRVSAKTDRRNETSGDRIKKRATRGARSERGGRRPVPRASRPVTTATSRAVNPCPRRASRYLAMSRPESLEGRVGRAARHFKHARCGGAETRACSGGLSGTPGGGDRGSRSRVPGRERLGSSKDV